VPLLDLEQFSLEENSLIKLAGMLLLLAGTASFALAAPAVPEIGPGSAGSAIALLSGALLVYRGRRKQ